MRQSVQVVPIMARLSGFSAFLCVAIAVAWALGGRASPAQPLLFSSDVSFDDDEPGGFDVGVVRQVLAAMNRDASFEYFPTNRAWAMVASGGYDGMLAVFRTSERERICSYPDEPTHQDKVVFFVRTADVGKLGFSSLDDLIGHDIAVSATALNLFKQPFVSPELWEFLREHHNMVQTSGSIESLRMLEAGRVDYAVMNLTLGLRNKAVKSGVVAPLMSRSVIEGGIYTCFSKARVEPTFVEAFSRALKQFKDTAAYQTIYRKYYP